MKILLYTNILTPYRIYFYDKLKDFCEKNAVEFKVLVMAKTEKNRPWMYKQYARNYTELLRGFSLNNGEMYVHFNIGLKKKLEQEKPDIVIVGGSYLCPGTWVIANLKKQLNYKVFFWSESHLGEVRRMSSLKIRYREHVRRKFYQKFDAFLCPGKLAIEFVKTYAGENTNCIFLPNLVDESKFTNDAFEYHRMADTIVFFTPARLSPVKGILEFIEVLGQCPSKNKISWFIAGEGELKDEIIKKAQINNVDVNILGQKSQNEIIELYKLSDVFVMPSLSDPNPLSCIEALWTGKPLLVSNHVGNYPEVINNGVNGYVFSYTNRSSAIKTVENIINCSNEWIQAAGEESKRIATTIYASEKAISRMLMELMKVNERIVR